MAEYPIFLISGTLYLCLDFYSVAVSFYSPRLIAFAPIPHSTLFIRTFTFLTRPFFLSLLLSLQSSHVILRATPPSSVISPLLDSYVTPTLYAFRFHARFNDMLTYLCFLWGAFYAFSVDYLVTIQPSVNSYVHFDVLRSQQAGIKKKSLEPAGDPSTRSRYKSKRV